MSMKPQQQIALQTLRASFGVDTTTADGLHGQELDDWIERQEDDAFERYQDEQRSLVNLQPQIAWEETGWNMDEDGITETKACILVFEGIFYAAVMSSERGGDERIEPFGPDRSSLDEAMQDVRTGARNE
jgi:hypothetical protein